MTFVANDAKTAQEIAELAISIEDKVERYQAVRDRMLELLQKMKGANFRGSNGYQV